MLLFILTFFSRYRAKNRKSVTRNNTNTKEHHIENHSPTEKNYQQTDDFYPITNNTNVNPLTIPTVVPLTRMSYDVPYSPTYPSNPPHYATSQPVYGPNPGNYPDIYGNAPHNMVLTNGGQFYTAQLDYANTAPINQQSLEFARRPNWEQMVRKTFYF